MNEESASGLFSAHDLFVYDDASTAAVSDRPTTEALTYLYAFSIDPVILDRIRSADRTTEVQREHQVPLTPVPPRNSRTPAQHPRGNLNRRANVNNNADQQALIQRLGEHPHVIQFGGVVLDHNERLKIIAAVAMCESGGAPFAAINADQEFVGRAHGARGIETSYSRIVHIGLSYGIIQFTQDGGSLGQVLALCNRKNHQKFTEVFGNNSDELLALTDSGIPAPGVTYASGLDHWHQISRTAAGRALAESARHTTLTPAQQIRGNRVQPIPIVIGGPSEDIWSGVWRQRFIDAAKVPDFQEAQLDYAVTRYLNPTLSFCKENNIRSSTALAFAVACKVRGVNPQLIVAAANQLNLHVPFTTQADEKSAVELIAQRNITSYTATHRGHVRTIRIDADEARRANLLIRDATGLLAEDFYWTGSYDNAHDV